MIAIGKKYWSAWSRLGVVHDSVLLPRSGKQVRVWWGVRLFVPMAILSQSGKSMRLYRGGLSHCWRSFVLRPQIKNPPVGPVKRRLELGIKFSIIAVNDRNVFVVIILWCGVLSSGVSGRYASVQDGALA